MNDAYCKIYPNEHFPNKNICINCGVIHDYQYVNEISFRDYNMIMSNILSYKKLFIKEKNICIINVFILKKLMTT